MTKKFGKLTPKGWRKCKIVYDDEEDIINNDDDEDSS
jgi:hypothetical protein